MPFKHWQALHNLVLPVQLVYQLDMVDLSNTMVDPPNTMVDFPDLQVQGQPFNDVLNNKWYYLKKLDFVLTRNILSYKQT